MKTISLLVAIAFPLLFGGTACAHPGNHGGIIVRVKTPDSRSGYLGVSIQDMTHRLARSMDVKTEEGALVNDVTEDSPADKAGIRDEDIIVEVDGKKISDADDLREVVRKITPDTKVNIVLMRKDEKKTLTATIGSMPRSNSYSYSFTPPSLPRMFGGPGGHLSVHVTTNSSMLGMELSELNEQLGKYFDAPNGKGVLVNEVEEDSRAAKAGFQAGDVIIRIGKETIEDVRDVEYALRDYKEGDKADVEVVRKGSKKTLTVEVPDMRRRHRYGFWSVPPGGWNDGGEMEWNQWKDGQNLRDNESLKKDMRKLELELRDLGRDIREKARTLEQELQSKLTGRMS